MRKRGARYGAHTYGIRVPQEARAAWELQEDTVYFVADSIVVKDGVLLLSVETDPVESFEDDSLSADEAIEYPPAAIFAPGQWFSAIMVDHEHQPFFTHRVEED
jgi:hypothetical protein